MRLLMFLLAAGEEGMAGQAEALVAEALREVGARGDIDELAAALTEDNPMWNLPRWQTDDAGNLVCDGEYSPRNSQGPFYNGVPMSLV